MRQSTLLVAPVWGVATAILFRAALEPHADYFDAPVFVVLPVLCLALRPSNDWPQQAGDR